MPDVWEQQRGESPRAYHAFCHYRDLGELRSLNKAWRQHRRECQQKTGERSGESRAWARLSSRWAWVARAQLWDAELDRRAREKHAHAHLEARERHARLAQSAMTVLSVPIAAILKSLQDPRTMQAVAERIRSSPDGLLAGVQLVARCAVAIPGLVNTERVALGLTTEFIEIGDERREPNIGDRITADPAATELAIALLDRLARAGSDVDPTTH